MSSSRAATAIVSRIAACEAATPVMFVKTVAASGTPEAMTATDTYFRKATVLGLKAYRTDNAGIVYLGPSSVNNEQPYALGPGGELILESVPGSKMNFKEWYIDVVTNGDGVVVIYT